MTLSGGRNDTVMDNTFANNGAWGTLFVPYPDSGTPSLHQKCANYGGYQISGLGCVFETENDALKGNTYIHDGFYGNPSNADFGQITPAQRAAGQLLRRQQRAERERAGQPGAAPAHVRRHHHDHQQRQHLARAGRVRHAPGGVPGRVELPAADGRASRADAPGPADDGQPVRRRPVERLVHLERLVAREHGAPRCARHGAACRRDLGLPPDRGLRTHSPLADAPALERHGLSHRAASPARWVISSTLRSPAAASTPSTTWSARPGRARSSARRGSRSAPGRGAPAPPRADGARPPTRSRRLRRPACRGPSGAWPPSRTAGRPRARRRSRLSVASGRPEGQVGAHGAGEQLGPLVGQGAGRPHVRLRQPRHVDARRARACPTRAASSAATR